MAYTPQIPVVNAGLLYINGLQLSNNATTPATLLNIAAGAARDSTNTNDIVLSDAVVLNLAAQGSLGIDTGAVAANTLYAVYVIGSSSHPVNSSVEVSAYPTSVVLSTNFSRPYLPANYDMFRRVGAVRSDGSSQFALFAQSGQGSSRRMWYGVPLATSITAGASTAYAVVGLNAVNSGVPIVSGVVAHLNVTLTPATAGNKVFLQPVGAASTVNITSMSGDVAAVAHNAQLSSPIGIASSLANLNYKVTAGGDAVAIQVAGYEDAL